MDKNSSVIQIFLMEFNFLVNYDDDLNISDGIFSMENNLSKIMIFLVMNVKL